MEILPNTKPAPRLLSTAAVDVRSTSADLPVGRHRLKTSSVFSGNGRAIFVGLLLGGLAITVAGYLFARTHGFEHELGAVRKFFAVRTHRVARGVPQEGLVAVRIDPSLLRVTAIALGHPRLAIINGQEVGVGDSVTVRTPDGAISVTLRVLKIADSGIDLTDGTQIVTTRLPLDGTPRRH